MAQPFPSNPFAIVDIHVSYEPSGAGARARAPAVAVCDAGSSRTRVVNAGRDFDLPRHSHYSGVIPMVFEHSVNRTVT